MSAQAEQARLQRDMAEQMMKTGVPMDFGAFGFPQSMPVGYPAARYVSAPVYAPKK